MSDCKFVHTADLHLDSPFQGIGQMDAGLQRQLTEATFQALHNVVEICLREEVDFLLIAGDLYNDADGSLKAQLRCREELRSLTEHGIQVFIAHGNHDHCGGWRADLDWPAGVHFFPAGEVACYPFMRNGVKVAEIYGVSYPERAVSESYLPKFTYVLNQMSMTPELAAYSTAEDKYTNDSNKDGNVNANSVNNHENKTNEKEKNANKTDANKNDDKANGSRSNANSSDVSINNSGISAASKINLTTPHNLALYRIGVLHTNVGSMSGHANYAPSTISELTEVGFDYWALGHVHSYQVSHSQDPLIVYPGTPQGRHPEESGAKGCVVVEVSSTGVTKHRWVETDVIRWLEVVQPIDGLTRVDDLITALSEQVDKLAGELAGRIGLVQIRLTGRGPIFRDLRRPGWLTDLLESLRETHSARGLYPTGIELQARPEIEIAALREEESLIGDFLKLTDQGQHLAAHPELENMLREELMPLLKEKSLRTLFTDTDRAGLERLIKASEELGIELFGLEVE